MTDIRRDFQEWLKDAEFLLNDSSLVGQAYWAAWQAAHAKYAVDIEGLISEMRAADRV